MLLPLVQSIFVVLFYAFTTVADHVGDGSDVKVCDDVARLESRVIYFDPLQNVQPEYGMHVTDIWKKMTGEDIVGVAIADRGFVTFRMNVGQSFPELMDQRTLGKIHLQATFIQEAPAFKKKFTDPLLAEFMAHRKKLGSFRMAFILSKHRGTQKSIQRPAFITAIAWVMKEGTKQNQVQWGTISSVDSQDLILQRIKANSGWTLSIQTRNQEEGDRNPRGSERLLFGASSKGSGVIEKEIVIGPPLATQPTFDKKDEIDTLTRTQRAYLKQTPIKIISDDSALTQPYSMTISLKKREDQVFWNDDNTKNIGLTIMIITSESVWILMIPTDLLNKHRLPSTVQSLRRDTWFQNKIKEQVLGGWKRALETGEVTGVLLAIGVMSNPGRSLLPKAILQEMWGMKPAVTGQSVVDGPLKPFAQVLEIPIFSSGRSILFDRGDDHLLSPINYFVCEKKYVEKLERMGDRPETSLRDWPGTSLRCALGDMTILDVSLADAGYYHISSLTSGLTDTIKFNPVSS